MTSPPLTLTVILLEIIFTAVENTTTKFTTKKKTYESGKRTREQVKNGIQHVWLFDETRQ